MFFCKICREAFRDNYNLNRHMLRKGHEIMEKVKKHHDTSVFSAPNNTSENSNNTSENPNNTSENPNNTSENPNNTSENPNNTSEKPNA